MLGPGSPFELVDEEFVGEVMRVPAQRPRTLRDVLGNSVGFGDAVYMVATDGVMSRRYTFTEHAQAVASVARSFSEQFGVGPGDRVAILGANSPEWIIAFWAAVSLGAIAVGLNGWWSGLEIEQGIADCEPALLVADRKRLDRLEGRDPGVPTVVIETDFAALESAHPGIALPDVEIAPDDPAIILYTSGTTGFPKGAVHTHANVCWLLSMIYWHGARSMMSSPPQEGAGPTAQFCTSPLFHVSGLHTGAVAYLATGTKAVWWQGRFDVLVCTTIIESGIDMPTVNTLVVERADLLGLGQMHQLRGRVGRSGSRAYAYLFHPPDARLSDEAYERLRTIGEATELGSGFKIAMRDLEIRGAGNLLGESQSGHIAAVGYDLYCQMVNEAVSEMKGEPTKEPSEVKLDVPTDAFLPVDYVPKEELRLEAYRSLAAVTSQAEVDDIRAEWIDRYGPVPEPADALLAVGSLRAECHRLGLRDVQLVGTQARLGPITLKTSEELRLRRLSRDSLYKPDQQQLVVPMRRGTEPASFLVNLLRELVPAAG